MIADGTDLWGRIALVTSAPVMADEDGDRLPLPSGLVGIGSEVVTIRMGLGGNVTVSDRYGDTWALHGDCLTIVSRFDRVPPAPITPDVAAHVLWHYRQLGYPPGSFISALIKAFAAADSGNRVLLARGFPDYGRAMHLAAEHPDGIEMLRRVMVDRRPL